MDEQSTNQNNPEAPKKNNPEIIMGILIAVIIILIGIGLYLLKNKNAGVQVPATTSEKTVQLETATTETAQTGSVANQVTQPDRTVTTSSTSASQTPVDFDYELKQLDTQVNSVSTTNLNDSEMTDTKAGL